MKIYFIRHGDPDYKNDCLTELGRKQAAAGKAACPRLTLLNDMRHTEEFSATVYGV